MILIFLKTCLLWGLLCSGSDGQPTYRDVQIQQNATQATRDALYSQSRQQALEIQATRDAADAKVRATAEAQNYAAQSEQRYIKATEQARWDAFQVTASAVEARERTDRTLIVETNATERLYKTEIERTGRLSMVIDFLIVLVLAIAALIMLRYISAQRAGPEIVDIPQIPQDVPRWNIPDFTRAAEANDWTWDIVTDGETTLGLRWIKGHRYMYLLEDKDSGQAT